ncbi:uncharacterized protein TRAVEDRAFT_20827 [Trametes versicolor FP-101664 SS1]|uniref:uncharacterized protein n=1 Tax=Trametes versicolor (strain FP-101664) TaxID=717944 RepID=UPI0004623552|nr:uncharacterized protein TRAVEDRAFT_20827 [Trametes versicolor FP-101664 SS1]EIW59035.1 hypothetical protein TRAVEDRAFT_20827 [Trametes versicolor FP-101664 SS1]
MSQPSHSRTAGTDTCLSPMSSPSADSHAPSDSSVANSDGSLGLTWSPPWRPKPEKTRQETPHGAEPILKPNDPRVLAHQQRVRTTRLMLDNFPNRGITDSNTGWIMHNDANYKRDALSGSTEQPAAARGSEAAAETRISTNRGGKPKGERTSEPSGRGRGRGTRSKHYGLSTSVTISSSRGIGSRAHTRTVHVGDLTKMPREEGEKYFRDPDLVFGARTSVTVNALEKKGEETRMWY